MSLPSPIGSEPSHSMVLQVLGELEAPTEDPGKQTFFISVSQSPKEWRFWLNLSPGMKRAEFHLFPVIKGLCLHWVALQAAPTVAREAPGQCCMYSPVKPAL